MSVSGRRIFVSYRRDDCAAHAGWLASTLRAADAGEVFIDVESIGLGENFVRRIEREIEACDVVLVVIGREWLTLTGHDGRPRIHDELDWVHLEVRSALERDIPVVPVLVEGAAMPRPAELPEAVRDLAYRNGIRLTEASWAGDVGRLVGLLPETKLVIDATGPAVRAAGAKPRRARSTAYDEDTVIVAGRIAYPEYREQFAYVCQAGRSFRPVQHLGFYTGKEIKREIASILHVRDDVLWTLEHAAELRQRRAPFDLDIASLILCGWDESSIWHGQRREGDVYKIFCLTRPDDERTLLLPRPVSHELPFGWTQNQRYLMSGRLAAAPRTTADL